MQKATNVIETWTRYYPKSSMILLLPGASVESKELPGAQELTINGSVQIQALSSIFQAHIELLRLIQKRSKFLCGWEQSDTSSILTVFSIPIDRLAREIRWVSRGVMPRHGYRQYEDIYPVVHCGTADILRIMLRASWAQYIWDEWSPQHPLDTLFITRTDKGFEPLVALSTLEDPVFYGLGP